MHRHTTTTGNMMQRIKSVRIADQAQRGSRFKGRNISERIIHPPRRYTEGMRL